MRSPLLVCVLAAIGCSANLEESTMCMDVADDAETCPAADDVDPEALGDSAYCDYEAEIVTGEGELTSSAWDSGDSNLICCYPVLAKDTEPRSACLVGRPFVQSGVARTAASLPGLGWASQAEGAPDPERVAAWLRMAEMEHASVAAFARLTLQLMALGAPSELLAGVQAAAVDEVEHARLAYGLASRFAGEILRPGALDIGEVKAHLTLPELAASAVAEGCLGETIGAYLAQRQADQAEDREVRAVLTRIAADEARHAALSWKIVAWALREGGSPVREAVLAAFAEPVPVDVQHPLIRGTDELELAHAAILEVVKPAFEALMAA